MPRAGKRLTAEVIGAAVGSPSQAFYYVANRGIPILGSVSPDATKPDTAKNGASAGTISIGAF